MFDGDEMKQFVEEYASAVHDATRTGTDAVWQKVDEILEDWKATAEGLGNEELTAALRSYRRQRKRS